MKLRIETDDQTHFVIYDADKYTLELNKQIAGIVLFIDEYKDVESSSAFDWLRKHLTEDQARQLLSGISDSLMDILGEPTTLDRLLARALARVELVVRGVIGDRPDIMQLVTQAAELSQEQTRDVYSRPPWSLEPALIELLATNEISPFLMLVLYESELKSIDGMTDEWLTLINAKRYLAIMGSD